MYDFYAHAYMEYFRSGFRHYSWTFDYADALLQSKPEEAFEFLLKLLIVARSEDELSWLAHIYFEEFLHFHLNKMNDRVTLESKTNRRLKKIIQKLSEERRFSAALDIL